MAIYQNLRVVLMHSLLQNTIRFYKYQILSFGVIPQKSEFFVKNGLNKTLFFKS